MHGCTHHNTHTPTTPRSPRSGRTRRRHAGNRGCARRAGSTRGPPSPAAELGGCARWVNGCMGGREDLFVCLPFFHPPRAQHTPLLAIRLVQQGAPRAGLAPRPSPLQTTAPRAAAPAFCASAPAMSHPHPLRLPVSGGGQGERGGERRGVKSARQPGDTSALHWSLTGAPLPSTRPARAPAARRCQRRCMRGAGCLGSAPRACCWCQRAGSLCGRGHTCVIKSQRGGGAQCVRVGVASGGAVHVGGVAARARARRVTEQAAPMRRHASTLTSLRS